MRKHLLLTLIIPTLALSACSFFFNEPQYETYVQELQVYDIDHLNENKELNEPTFRINARFIQDQKYIPFITLKQYAYLYLSHFDNDITYEIKDDTWTIYKNKQACFIAAIDHFYKEVGIAGSIQNAYKDGDDPRDLTVLRYGAKNDYKINDLGIFTGVYSFAKYNIPRFKFEGDYYYPLSFLDTTFSDSSSIYFTYNYKYILSTRDVENYSAFTYKDGENEYTFDSQMEEMCKEDNAVIPSYLSKYNANLFLYMMDNFYGLKEMKGINSFSSYYKKQYGIYDALYSSDNEKRGFGYSDALAVLDDNHSLFISANKSWGEDPCGRYRRYGEGCYNRNQTRTQLNQYRTATYGEAAPQKDVLISQDGKTALFSFDSFKFGTSEEVFNEDKSIKDTAKEHDTFFLLIDTFNYLKNNTSVENVILDISLNGGGVLGVMLKLLALISKDNSSAITLQTETKQIFTYNPHCDINSDNKYDANDCFGDDFNIYLLTSDCSFSCGNALPCAAQLHNDAKIIGQKSGGGECVVSVHYMPNSEYVYHSSMTHIGIYSEEEKAFKGFESGATPDIEIAIDENFYNIESLNTIIQNAQ